MNPEVLGKKYDKIARWWHERHDRGDYGVSQLQRAFSFCGPTALQNDLFSEPRRALDVGCGAGGRVVRIMEAHDYQVTGVDVSVEMIKLATANHPAQTFINRDICSWKSNTTFDLIVAWDSLFHLPLGEHDAVVSKLCGWLKEDGVLLYTFGNTIGEHEDQWLDDTFYYSSIGISGNLRLLMDNGLTPQHMELDQYPERHVCVIAKKQPQSA